MRVSKAGGGNLTGEVQSLRSATQPSPRFRRQLSLSRLIVVSRQIETDHTRSASRSVDGSPPGCGTDPPCDARLAGHDATTIRSLLLRAVATDNAEQVCVRAPFSTAFGQFRTPTCAESGNSRVRLIRYGMCEERRAIRRMESRRPRRPKSLALPAGGRANSVLSRRTARFVEMKRRASERVPAWA